MIGRDDGLPWALGISEAGGTPAILGGEGFPERAGGTPVIP